MSDRIEIHVNAERGVPPRLLAAIGKAIVKESPGAVMKACDTDACGECNFLFVGGE